MTILDMPGLAWCGRRKGTVAYNGVLYIYEGGLGGG